MRCVDSWPRTERGGARCRRGGRVERADERARESGIPSHRWECVVGEGGTMGEGVGGR